MPTSRSSVASMICCEALGSVRSMANVRVSALVCWRIPLATPSSTCCRRATSATFTPSSARRSANRAPTPSDAPTTRAHGPYFSAMSVMVPAPRRGEPRCRSDVQFASRPSFAPRGRVVTDGIRARSILEQDQRIDVGTYRGFVAVDVYSLIRHAMHRAGRHDVSRLHELGDLGAAGPLANLAVVQLRVVGEDLCQQRVLLRVDRGRVANRQLDEVVSVTH